MAGIKSYVFIKMSTRSMEYSDSPAIIELSMVGVARENMAWSASLYQRANRPDDIHPTVLNRLTLSRELIPIPDEVDETGRPTQRYFSEGMFNIIHNFIDILPKPVCLIAYSGMNFAFPRLKRNFASVGRTLPDDVLCTDLLYAAYDLRDSEFDMRNVEYSLDVARSRVRRDIFYNNDPQPDDSYKSRDVYTRLVRRELNPGLNDTLYDCLRLVEIAVKLGDQFIQWVDYSHKRFND